VEMICQTTEFLYARWKWFFTKPVNSCGDAPPQFPIEFTKLPQR